MKRTIFAFSALTFAFASYSAIAATKHAAEKAAGLLCVNLSRRGFRCE